MNCLVASGDQQLANSALEQAASSARPWQRAQRKQCALSGPRPVTRPPLLTAGVRQPSFASSV